MLKNGFIKLERSILDWEWYDDIITKTVFVHLLLTVNIKDDSWHGMTIRRGSRVSSFSHLADELHLSVRNVRTAVSHLETTGEVTRSAHSKFTVFTVNNYEKFQTPTNKTTSNRHSNDKEPTSNRQQNKNIKNIEEYKEYSFCADKPAREKFELFERLWREYPRKRNKYKISDSRKSEIEHIGYEAMHKAIERCIVSKPEYQKDLMNGDTFFNGGYKDYLETSEESGGETKKKWQG